MTAMPAQRSLLTVVSNADEGFFPGMAVAVASAVAAASGDFDYHFLILDGGLAPEALVKLGKTIAGDVLSKAGRHWNSF
jgi:lipopolysaccharide biosynthesis glycosyltransferase